MSFGLETQEVEVLFDSSMKDVVAISDDLESAVFSALVALGRAQMATLEDSAVLLRPLWQGRVGRAQRVAPFGGRCKRVVFCCKLPSISFGVRSCTFFF
jgi:hypothetical protein